MKKAEIKPGRSVSKIGMFGGVVGIIFGILWIGLVLHLSSQNEDMGPSVYFLLFFGVVFIVASIVIMRFYSKAAFGKDKDRPSLVDVEETADGDAGASAIAGNQGESKDKGGFCPYCGKAIGEDYAYCRSCGKKLP